MKNSLRGAAIIGILRGWWVVVIPQRKPNKRVPIPRPGRRGGKGKTCPRTKMFRSCKALSIRFAKTKAKMGKRKEKGGLVES